MEVLFGKMLIFRNLVAIQQHLSELRKQGLAYGFVPTMGALHLGHLTLVRRAKAENSVCVASIFVNPTQFNDLSDLTNYPRTPELDLKLLEEAGCDIVFMPSVDEIYPTLPVAGADLWKSVKLGNIGEVMEARMRKGHFEGVMQVVSRLFSIVQPDIAYFGQKDFQQLAIIRAMTRQLGLGIKIVMCDIVREADGLAMSSRNVRLTPEERTVAPLLYQLLSDVALRFKERSIEEHIEFVTTAIQKEPLFQLEYFKIVGVDDLSDIADSLTSGPAVACIAAKLGKIRLIDNILLN